MLISKQLKMTDDSQTDCLDEYVVLKKSEYVLFVLYPSTCLVIAVVIAHGK